MRLINKKSLKEKFKQAKMKIGNKALKEFVNVCKKNILLDIEKAVRKARISGRKVVKKQDFL